MNFLLNTDLNNTKLYDAPTEILGLGGQVVLIGMLTVFAVLGLLWACLTVFKIVFHDIPAKKSGKSERSWYERRNPRTGSDRRIHGTRFFQSRSLRICK